MKINTTKYIWKIALFDLLLIELGPVIIFLIIFNVADFFLAALALAITTLVALILSKVVNKRLPYFALFAGAITIITSFFAFYFKYRILR